MSFVASAVVGAAAVSAFGTYKAGKAAGKASKKQKKADKLQSWQNQMQELRDYQMSVALAGTAWEGSGASLESSGAMGARSAAGSQVSNNLEMLGRGAQLANKATNALADSNRWGTVASIAGTIGSTIGAISTVTPQDPGTSVSSGPPRRYSRGANRP